MDWIESTAGQEFVESVLTGMVPKMADSTIVMSLMPDGEFGNGDVKFWVETGAAICMDKPILLVVAAEAEIPPKLEKIADRVIRIPENGMNDPAFASDLADAAKEMSGDV